MMTPFERAEQGREEMLRGNLRRAARLFHQAASEYQPQPEDDEQDYAAYWEGHATACQDLADARAG